MLQAIVVHSGQSNDGHYVTFVRPFYCNNWYKFDDSDVSQPIPEKDVLQKEPNMLFYYRKSLQSSEFPKPLHTFGSSENESGDFVIDVQEGNVLSRLNYNTTVLSEITSTLGTCDESYFATVPPSVPKSGLKQPQPWLSALALNDADKKQPGTEATSKLSSTNSISQSSDQSDSGSGKSAVTGSGKDESSSKSVEVGVENDESHSAGADELGSKASD